MCKWKVSAYDGWDCVRDEHDSVVCKLVLNEPDNAYLICTAVNACKAINPDNPQAAAEAIEYAFAVIDRIKEETYNAMEGAKRPESNHYACWLTIARQALSLAKKV